MKIQFTYQVVITVDEEKGADVEAALNAAAVQFDKQCDVTEENAEEIEDEDDVE